MTAQIFNAIQRGYPAFLVLNEVVSRYPKVKRQVKSAQQAGYDSKQILKGLMGDTANPDDDSNYMTEHEKTMNNDKQGKKQAAMGLVGTLGTAAALATAGYALSQRGKAVYPSQILPAQNNQPQLGIPYQGQQGLPAPRSPTPQAPQQPPQRPNPITPRPNSPIAGQPSTPQTPTAQPSGSVITPPYKHDPQFNRNVIQNIKADQRISTAVATGLGTAAIAQLLKESLPKGQLAVINKLTGGLEQVIEDYKMITQTETSKKGKSDALTKFKERQQNKKGLIEEERERFDKGYNRDVQQEPDFKENEAEATQQTALKEEQVQKEKLTGKGVESQSIKDQIIQNEIASIEQTQEKISQLESQIQEMPDDEVQQQLEFWNNKLNEQMQRLQEVEAMEHTDFEDELPKLEQPKGEEKQKTIEVKVIGNLAINPKGQVGQVESIKDGVAKVNVDGKITSHKLKDIQQEPPGMEDSVRSIIDSIPESDKSTSLQSVVLIPFGNENIMMTQFYDGKWAWYKGVSQEDYSIISLGNYTPKGTAKTGIAEYKAGVMDSRGSAFHNLVKIDPRFSGEFKNINWGYADNEYSLLHKIQPIIHKISKERKDEEGNIIVPKKRKPKD